MLEILGDCDDTQLVTGSKKQLVKFVKRADGGLNVHGMLAGQQLNVMPDGRLQIVSKPPPGSNSTHPSLARESVPATSNNGLKQPETMEQQDPKKTKSNLSSAVDLNKMRDDLVRMTESVNMLMNHRVSHQRGGSGK